MTAPRPAERGVALLNALIILAVVAGISAALLRSSGEAHGLLAMQINADRAVLGTKACEMRAHDLLRADLAASDTDHAGEQWAAPEAMISDAQARFELRGLTTASAAWQRLVAEMGGTGDQAQRMAAAAPRFPSALYRVPDIPIALVRRLEPHLIALPAPAGININTASRVVLQALAPRLQPADVDQIVAARPFGTVGGFVRMMERLLPPAAMAELRSHPLGVTSRFFLIDCRTRVEQSAARRVSLVERTPDQIITHWRLDAMP